MVQDVIKGDAGIATVDTSLINARIDELEDKVSKMEQWLTNLQAITDTLIKDISAPATGIDVAAVKIEDSEAEAAITAAAESEEIAATEDAIVPDREKEEKAKKISKAAADKIRATSNELAARAAFTSNKLFNNKLTISYKN